MATYRAISTGVYSDLARWEVWDGSAWVAAGVLPTVADEVYANGFTVTIDVDFFASAYRTTSLGIGVNANGSFTLLGGITMTGDVFGNKNVNNTATVDYDTSATADSFIIGNVTGGNGVGRRGVRNNNIAGGKLTIVGSVFGGNGASGVTGGGADGLILFAASQTTVTGDAICVPNGSAIVNMTGIPSAVIVLGRSVGLGVFNGSRGVTAAVLEGSNYQCLATEKLVIPADGTAQFFQCKVKAGNPISAEVPDDLGNTVTLNDSIQQGYPVITDVRLNTAYANGTLTGTAAIPPAASVALNVPVDATVGTAFLDADDLGQYITPQILSAITGLP